MTQDTKGFPSGSDSKESASNVGDPGSFRGSGRSPGEGNGYPLQYSSPRESHGQRIPVGYSPRGCKASDTVERLTRLLLQDKRHNGTNEEGEKRSGKKKRKAGETEVYRELESKSKACEKKRAQISHLEFKTLETSVYMDLLPYFWPKCDLPV